MGASARTPAAAEVAPLARESWSLFSQTTAAEVAPFHVQAASGLFGWVRAAAGVSPPP